MRALVGPQKAPPDMMQLLPECDKYQTGMQRGFNGGSTREGGCKTDYTWRRRWWWSEESRLLWWGAR